MRLGEFVAWESVDDQQYKDVPWVKEADEKQYSIYLNLELILIF